MADSRIRRKPGSSFAILTERAEFGQMSFDISGRTLTSLMPAFVGPTPQDCLSVYICVHLRLDFPPASMCGIEVTRQARMLYRDPADETESPVARVEKRLEGECRAD